MRSSARHLTVCAILIAPCLVAVCEAGPNATSEFLPPLPEGKTWTLAWSDEFDGRAVDETKWERLGDWKRRDGFWVKEDSYLDGQGNLILMPRRRSR